MKKAPVGCFFMLQVLLFQRFGAQLGKRDDVLRRFRVLGNELFHPHHVIPCSEFVAAFIKPADHAITKMRVILGTVVRQMLIRLIRPAYAGFKVYYALSTGKALKRGVQHFADAHFAAVAPQIYRCLRRPQIRSAPDKRAEVGIAKKLAVFLRDYIGIPRQLMHHALGKLLKARNDSLEAYGRVLDIGCIERQ